MTNNKYVDGAWFNKPHQNAPDFVLGGISYHKEKFLEWLQAQTPDEKGYVKTQVKAGKDTGKPYMELDTYNLQAKDTVTPAKTSEEVEMEEVKSEEIDPEDIPF